MKSEDIIKDKYGKNPGFKVPENYFHDLEMQIMESLPPYPQTIRTIERSRWQRIKPYVYLAAMFCGIWLMMKVFHSVTQPMYTSLDNPPEALGQLLDSDSDDEVLQLSYPVSDYEMEEEISENYDSIEDFERDFGYTLSPEYAGGPTKFDS